MGLSQNLQKGLTKTYSDIILGFDTFIAVAFMDCCHNHAEIQEFPFLSHILAECIIKLS